MTPEREAREEIDRQLAACGWQVQDFKKINPSTGPGIAVREFALQSGEADYLLYAQGKAIGVIEAKPAGHTLKGVEMQSSKYTLGLPPGLPVWHRPLPFAYESTGAVTQFTNALEPDYRSRDVFTFHQDAYATARWLAQAAAQGILEHYFQPSLTLEERGIAALEGWIFGVG